MRLLARHLLGSYLWAYALTLLAALLIAGALEMLLNLDDVVEHREAAGGALAYLGLRVLALHGADVQAAASFLAAFLSIGLSARAHEFAAARAGGIPPERLITPVALGAVLLSGFSLFLNETAILSATRSLQRVEHAAAPAFFGQGSFWYHRGDTIYNVGEVSRDRLHDVRVFELDAEGRLRESLRAAEGEASAPDQWELRGVTRRHFEPGQADAAPRLERVEHLPLTAAANDLAAIEASERTLSLAQLRDAAARERSDGLSALRRRASLHARLAAPGAVAVFALLALPLALRVERTRSLARALLPGLALVALFYACWHGGLLVAASGHAPGPAAPWLVLATFAALALGLLGRAPH